MDRCIGGCRGLCCRNVAIDEIIGFADLVYIVGRHPDLRNRLAACLAADGRFLPLIVRFSKTAMAPASFPKRCDPRCASPLLRRHRAGAAGNLPSQKGFHAVEWFLGRVTIHQALRRTVGRFPRIRIQIHDEAAETILLLFSPSLFLTPEGIRILSPLCQDA